MINYEILLQACVTGLGSGIGSYFGIRWAEKSMQHLRELVSKNRVKNIDDKHSTAYKQEIGKPKNKK